MVRSFRVRSVKLSRRSIRLTFSEYGGKSQLRSTISRERRRKRVRKNLSFRTIALSFVQRLSKLLDTSSNAKKQAVLHSILRQMVSTFDASVCPVTSEQLVASLSRVIQVKSVSNTVKGVFHSPEDLKMEPSKSVQVTGVKRTRGRRAARRRSIIKPLFSGW